MISIVGYTGFVGSNLCDAFNFDKKYNSQNIEEAYGTKPDLLVYAGVRAEMFLANNYPEKDMEIIQDAIENIKKINPKNVVLISTIGVYDAPVDVDETSEINESESLPYGRNRRVLEKWVHENYQKSLIVRLPAIYGINMKKNFIYDYINLIPALLTYSKYDELYQIDGLLAEYYNKQDNGFYKCTAQTDEEKRILKSYFNKVGFSAINFTDSRSVYQFYNLKYLWKHICIALENSIRVVNMATEPVSAGEVYKFLSGKNFENELAKAPYNYDFKTIHCDKYSGKNGYIFTKQMVLEDLKQFIEQNSKG